eukprot:12466599-Heterocapsa_arctica.AAC.2
MLNNYIRYIQDTLVREDALNNKKIKGSPTGKKGRQIIIPEQMGHEVQTCGDYEYCLGCGRTTKAKHSILANRVCWRRQYCKPVMRMQRYRRRNLDIVFDDWWACKNCQAKGPELNKRSCANPRHNHAEEDDDDSGHRHNIRKTYDEAEF